MKFIFASCLILISLSIQVFAENGHVHQCLQRLVHEREPGCTAEILRWYHDHENGGDCKPFMYNGCTKNDNNFETKEECDKICTEWHKTHCMGTPLICI